MPRDKSLPIEYRDSSNTEASLQTVKSFVDIFGSLVPVVGPTIGKGIEYSLETLRENRIREYVSAVSEYLEKMPEHIYKSEEFAEGIKKGIFRYINEGNSEKRRLLINMNRSFMKLLPSGKESVFNIYLIFDELFGQLSLPTLQCLMQFQEQFKLKAKKELIVRHFLDTQEIHGRRCFSELVTQGLLEEEEEYRGFSFTPQVPKVIQDQDRVYRVSPLAGVFLCWLNHQLDNEAKQTPSEPEDELVIYEKPKGDGFRR